MAELFSTTYEHVINFRSAAQLYLRQNPHATNRLSFAVTKMLQKTRKFENDYYSQMEETRIKYASKEDGNVLKNPDGASYKYTSENQIKCDKEIRRIMESPVQIEQHLVPFKDLPASFNLTFLEPFENIVVPELSEEEFLTLELGPKKETQQK